MMIQEVKIVEMQTIFTTTAREVCVFTGIGDREYAEEFIEAARHFLAQPGKRLRMACQCGGDIMGCAIIKALINAPERQGEIRVHDANIFCGAPYFMLAGKTGYRMEITALHETITDYHDPEAVQKLYAYYQQILAHSPQVLHRQPMVSH